MENNLKKNIYIYIYVYIYIRLNHFAVYLKLTQHCKLTISHFLFVFRFFLMWTIFKVFIEFATILLLFYVLVFWLQGMWDPSSRTRDQTRTPCTGR